MAEATIDRMDAIMAKLSTIDAATQRLIENRNAHLDAQFRKVVREEVASILDAQEKETDKFNKRCDAIEKKMEEMARQLQTALDNSEVARLKDHATLEERFKRFLSRGTSHEKMEQRDAESVDFMAKIVHLFERINQTFGLVGQNTVNEGRSIKIDMANFFFKMWNQHPVRFLGDDRLCQTDRPIYKLNAFIQKADRHHRPFHTRMHYSCQNEETDSFVKEFFLQRCENGEQGFIFLLISCDKS